MEDAIKIRLVADVNVGVFLSSGIDSSLISLISNKINPNIETLTIGFKSKKYDETKDVNSFTSFFNINNENKILSRKNFQNEVKRLFDSFDEPFSDESAIAYMLLSRSAKEKFKVVLSGDGSDESFLGYDKFFISNKVLALFKLSPFPRELCLRLLLIFFKRNYLK